MFEPNSDAAGGLKRNRGDTAGDSKSISSEYISIGSACYGHAAPHRDVWQEGPANNARLSASFMRQKRQAQKKNDGQYQVAQVEEQETRALEGAFFEVNEADEDDNEDYESCNDEDDKCRSHEVHEDELMQKLVLGLKTSASLEDVEEGGDADANPCEIPHGPPLPPHEERGDELLHWMASVGGYDGATKVTQQTANDGDETTTATISL